MTTAMTFEGTDELQEAAAQEALHYAQRVKAMRTALGTQHFLKFRDFGDGMCGYFISTPFIERAHLIMDGIKPKINEIRERFGLRTAMDGLGVPDIAAGVVISPLIETVELDPEKVEGATPEEIEKGEYIKVRRIKDLKVTARTKKRIGEEFTHQRMAVKVVDSMKTLADNAPVAGEFVEWGQTRRVRPGNYTGLMRYVVQLLLGLGNVSHNTYELREKDPPVKLTSEIAKKFIEEIKDGIASVKEEIAKGDYVPPEPEEEIKSGFGLYEEDVNVQVQINYDYRFHKSHGIVRAGGEDEDQTPYIWEISNEGMFVWPMPLDPFSKTDEGMERYKELYPELEDTGLMDFLGGFPTGEQIPVSINKKRAVNAGEMRKVLTQDEMREFYGKQPYYSNQGWAFAETMPVAMNCCRDYGEDKVMVGYLYSASVNIDKKLDEPEPAKGAAALYGRLRESGLAAKLMYADKKVPRMTQSQIEDTERRLDQYLWDVSRPGADKEKFFDAFEAKFDDIEVEPVINATGVLAESRRGFVYHPNIPYSPSAASCHSFSQQPQIKFPEEILGHGVSLDLSRATPYLQDREPPNPKPICDTVIWVWASGNTFKYINYQWKEEDGGDTKEPENDRGECQYNGKWTETTEGGNPVQCGHFYTSDVDLRQKLVKQGTKTVAITGHERGFKDMASWYCWGIPTENPYFWRVVYYSFDTETNMSGTRGYNSAIAVPFGSRSTYYTIETETRYGKKWSLSVGEAEAVGTTGSTRWGHIIDWRDYIIENPSQYVASIEWTLPLCHLTNWCLPAGKILPPNVDPVVLTEWTPVDPTSGCFAKFGPPDFPDYSPSPNRDPEPGCDKPDLPNTVSNIPGYSTSTPAKNSFKYKIRLWGQPGLEDNNIKHESYEWEEGEEFYSTFDTEMSGWWFIYMPTMCNTFSSIDVNASWWGSTSIGAYQYQWDDDEVAYGDPEYLRASVRATYFGYIE